MIKYRKLQGQGFLARASRLQTVSNIDLKSSPSRAQQQFRNQSELDRKPVDVVVFTPDATRTHSNQELQYTTVPSMDMSFHDSYNSSRIQSNRLNDANNHSRPKSSHYLRVANELLDNGTSYGEIYDHNAKNIADHLNLSPFNRSILGKQQPSNIRNREFKPIHPAQRNDINGLPLKTSKTYDLTSHDRDISTKYPNQGYYDSDPYLSNVPVANLYQNPKDHDSSRNSHLESIAMKRVRLAIPKPVRPHMNLPHISSSKSIDEGSELDSLLQISIDEGGEVNITNSYNMDHGKQTGASTCRPTGFGGRILPQAPEASNNKPKLLDEDNSVKSTSQNCNSQDAKTRKGSNDIVNGSHARSPSPNPYSGHQNYFKRRRTAVFGLSPTSGLNIGAVM